MDEDKARDREDKVRNLTIGCAVTIHPVQRRYTNHQQAYPLSQTL